MRNNTSRRLAILLGSLCFLGPFAQAQNVEIRQVKPLGLIPGKTNEITFTGQNVDSAQVLWTSFKSVCAKLPDSPQGGARFSLFFEPSAAAGIQFVQLLGPKGASNFRLMLIDSLPAQISSEKNRLFKEAQSITPPIAIDGTFKNEAADYYGFDAGAGQRFSIETVAHRLGSSADPVLRVLDADQREIAFNEDDALGERDSRFEFVAPRKGRFYIDAHDVAYQGGNAFEYRLRVGSFPLLSYTYPLGVERDHRSMVEILGPTAEHLGEVTLSTKGMEWSRTFLVVSNGFAPVLVDSEPELTEVEPNDTIESASPVSVPGIWNGRFQSGTDKDLFVFEAAKDQRIAFRGETRSAGSPCDLVLKLTAVNGRVLAESNPADPGEGGITNLFEQSGRYYLHVSELTGQHGPAIIYRVIAQDSPASFEVSGETDRLALPSAGNATLKLAITRSGYGGAIQISADGLPDSFTLENIVADAGKKELDLKISASPSAKPGDFHHFRLRAFPKDAPATSAFVTTQPALKKSFPALLHPPPELDGLFTVVVTGEKSATTAQN